MTKLSTPHTIVADIDSQGVASGVHLDCHARRMPVLCHIHKGLRHHVIRGDLDRLGQTVVHAHVKIDRHRGAAGPPPPPPAGGPPPPPPGGGGRRARRAPRRRRRPHLRGL